MTSSPDAKLRCLSQNGGARMQRGHGDADKLIVGDFDQGQFDQIVAAAVEDDEAAGVARTILSNNFVGPGRFGRMFPDLDPFRPPDEALRDLGRAMREIAPNDPALDNSDIPSGFTYLGQFIDHDITRDPTQDFPVIDDPDEIPQARNPNLDLDSLYGLGPRRQRELYDQTLPSKDRERRAMFKIGLTSSVPSPGGSAPGTPTVPVSMPHDLPRRNQTAVIGDPRNDENIVVAQTHLAFLKFHNKVLLFAPDTDDEGRDARFTRAEEGRRHTPFHQARQRVRWHYQWMVLNDFLPRFVDTSILEEVKANGPKFYKFRGRPFMPLEFSGAAYRFGHSLVRENYNYNRVFAHRSVEPNALAPATLRLLFRFTGGGGDAPIPSNWIVDWRRFHDVGEQRLTDFTRLIDTRLIPQLHELPGIAEPQPRSLAVRNLLRGSRVGLPKAQDLAEAIGIAPLGPDEIASGDDGPILRKHNLHQETPLWYYVLKEAEIQGGGKRLGEMGSRILAEVFVGLLRGSSSSFLSKEPDWKPDLPSHTPGTFTMADLLRFVDEIDPIG